MIKKSNMLDTYIFGKMLGKGGFSSVYAVKHKELGEERVVKVIKKTQENMMVDFDREFTILKELDHPNIIKLYEVFETNDFIQVFHLLFDNGQCRRRKVFRVHSLSLWVFVLLIGFALLKHRANPVGQILFCCHRCCWLNRAIGIVIQADCRRRAGRCFGVGCCTARAFCAVQLRQGRDFNRQDLAAIG